MRGDAGGLASSEPLDDVLEGLTSPSSDPLSEGRGMPRAPRRRVDETAEAGSESSCG